MLIRNQVSLNLSTTFHSLSVIHFNMPKSKRTHEECRQAVCIVCGGKSDRNDTISDALLELIREYVIHDYMIDDDRLPSGICKSDRNLLHEYKNGVYRRKLKVQSFEQYAKYNMRHGCDEGRCQVCNVARSTPFSEHTPPAKRKPGRPSIPHDSSSEISSLPTSIKLCPKCLSQVGRGFNHTCTKNEKIKNTMIMLSPKSRERICSSILTEKGEANSEAAGFRLATAGRPVQIDFDSPCSSTNRRISSDEFSDLQCSMNLSSNQIVAVAKTVRQAMGRNAIEPNLKEKLTIMGRRLENYFKSCEIGFFKKSSRDSLTFITRPVVMIEHVKSFLDEVFKIRNITRTEENLMFKLGIDGGQGFFKVCLNIIREDEDYLTSSSASKEGSVKGLFILAIVPDMEELYRNVQICLDNIEGLDELPYVVATDLKLANILCGLQSHGSQHPCCYCEGTAGIWETDAKTRTLKNIRCHHQRWIRSGGSLSDSKNYFNCVNEPLLKSDIRSEEEPILNIIPPPELHLLMGTFNRIFQEMKSIWPDVERMWSERFYAKPVGYHGGSNFTGGDCRKLLLNVDSLAAICPIGILPFVDSLRKLCHVVDACFGSDLRYDFQEKIAEFETSFLDLGIGITPKVHILLRHVPEFCWRHEKALGRFSEQASESVHVALKEFWKKRKVSDLSNPRYEQSLRQTVVEFNSKHL